MNDLTINEMKQIREQALDDVFDMKRKDLDYQKMTTFEQYKTNAKQWINSMYMNTFMYVFFYKEYLKYTFRNKIYNEVKNVKSIYPRPSNFISSEFRQNTRADDEHQSQPRSGKTEGQRGRCDPTGYDEEKKYPDE